MEKEKRKEGEAEDEKGAYDKLHEIARYRCQVMCRKPHNIQNDHAEQEKPVDLVGTPEEENDDREEEVRERVRYGNIVDHSGAVSEVLCMIEQTVQLVSYTDVSVFITYLQRIGLRFRGTTILERVSGIRGTLTAENF